MTGEYSVYTEHGKIEQNRNRDFSFKIESKSIVWLKSHIVTALRNSKVITPVKLFSTAAPTLECLKSTVCCPVLQPTSEKANFETKIFTQIALLVTLNDPDSDFKVAVFIAIKYLKYDAK